jgi:hypothetical protein
VQARRPVARGGLSAAAARSTVRARLGRGAGQGARCLRRGARRPAVEGVEEPVFYRGEQVGTRRKYDSRLLLAHLARLDKLQEDEAALADAGRFDELLARIAGDELPEDMESEDGVLPLDRERLAVRWGYYADAAQRELHAEAEADEEDAAEADDDTDDYDDEDDEDFDEAAEMARMDERVAAYRRGVADGEREWDKWFAQVCSRVDRATGWSDEPPAPGLPGGLPLPRRECARDLPSFTPRTVSNVSTSALARSLAGPAKGFVAPPPLRSLRQAMR